MQFKLDELPNPDPLPTPPPPQTKGQKDLLKAIDVLKSDRNTGAGIGKGVELSYRQTFTDGKQGIWKPGGYWKNEVAGSDIADKLGLNDLVPATVEREQEGKVGSLQAFVPESKLPAEVLSGDAYGA